MKLSKNTDFFQTKKAEVHVEKPEQSSSSGKQRVKPASERQSSAGIIVLIKQVVDILEKCGFRKLSSITQKKYGTFNYANRWSRICGESN